MLEEMKKSLSGLGVLAAAYLPPGFKEVLLKMATRIDEQDGKINQLIQLNKALAVNQEKLVSIIEKMEK